MGSAFLPPWEPKWGNRTKPSVLITGDGSILMNCQEFTTLPTYGIQVKTIVLRNGQLGMVRQLQGLFRGAGIPRPN